MMRAIWPWLRILIGVCILAGLAWRLGTDAFVDGLRVINGPAVLAALGIGLLTTVCSAWRWCLVARGLGLRLPLTTAVADYYRALFLNAVLPAGVLGDVHRAVRHGKHVGDVGRGVRAVVLERVAGQVVIFAAGAAVLVTQPALVSTATHQLVPSTGIVIGVLGLAGTAIALAAWTRWGPGSSRVGSACATALADARLGLLSRGAWPGVVLLSAAALTGHLALFLVATRVVGISAPVVQLLPLMLLALVVMGLPVNVGGWGPREAVSALAFGAAGLGAAQGLTAAVVYGVLAFVASLPGVAVLMLRRSTRKAQPELPVIPRQGRVEPELARTPAGSVRGLS